jgi:hypothetical protein
MRRKATEWRAERTERHHIRLLHAGRGRTLPSVQIAYHTGNRNYSRHCA